MQNRIAANLKESIEVKQQVIKSLVPQIEKAARAMIGALKNGNKVLFFGNGGSAADSQHLAAELISRFQMERKSLPAIALTTDTSIITAIGNDYTFDNIFSRQIEGLAQKGDIAFGLSTSGNSKNVIAGLEKAKQLGCKTIGLVGSGGRIAAIAEIAIAVPSKNTPRVQECHITIGHILCSLIEQELFGK
ncbi:phosphoheptose isomerase [candidate division WOR-1 bacterium RIFCSPHIGHO2_01_FULL_53_15]|uniref:Phosphoheptose isomerase n=1 Tax=candidate division WOR-1 bacterium RIFCSPHIGHO2_01_FULL_53_15 TaxID=1802564 RepID=A0A1F4Q4C2_UNCSA|nr:MAG: phosphoheptose isomerase [candidate division WOR-1 bacterium RIFCSPHIGHO2_01_FULL_53_15]OGC13262.1 MAG: phosphoheptose isomerase [candidate division WOR-1 bacterium RIFCSPHIGHO2_02_FULL_53_26]